MATLIFQRATWRLQVSRTSRNLIISFTTASPQRSNPRHQIAELTSRHSDHHQVRPSRYHQACTAYTSTRAYRSAQQVQQQTSSYPQANTRPSPAAAGTTPSRLPASNNISASPQGPTSSPKDASEYQDLTGGLSDEPIVLDEGDRQVDWARSFHGLSTEAFPKEAADVLLQTITPDDIEVKPDGIIYLPEIKYRRILNRAFGPGGWGLAPRGETIVTAKSVTREYALVVLGRYVIPILEHSLHNSSAASFPCLSRELFRSQHLSFPLSTIHKRVGSTTSSFFSPFPHFIRRLCQSRYLPFPLLTFHIRT